MILVDDSLAIVSDSESGLAQMELGISASKRSEKKGMYLRAVHKRRWRMGGVKNWSKLAKIADE